MELKPLTLALSQSDELEDGALAEVTGHLRTGVVSAEFLLVDVFLEDVAEHVGIDFLVVAAGRVVEIPRVAAEQRENVLERDVGNEDAVWSPAFRRFGGGRCGGWRFFRASFFSGNRTA